MEAQLQGGKVIQACGRGESNILLSCNIDDPIEKRIETLGRVDTKDAVRIVDGEIQIHQSYIMDRLEGLNPIVDQCWFPTGDLGEFDNDGYLRITGRKKLLFTYGFHKINPIEVEEIVDQIEEIEKSYCVYVTLSTDMTIEHPCVCFIGDSTVTKETISKPIHDVFEFKLPYVMQVNEFPMTVSGKIDRRKLTEIVNNSLTELK